MSAAPNWVLHLGPIGTMVCVVTGGKVGEAVCPKRKLIAKAAVKVAKGVLGGALESAKNVVQTLIPLRWRPVREDVSAHSSIRRAKAMPTFISQGTIRVATIEGITGLPDQECTLLFSPASDYSIRHWGNDLAVFVSQEVPQNVAQDVPLQTRIGVSRPISRGAIVREYSQCRVIEVTTGMPLANLPWIISNAASNQTKIQIRVNAPQNYQTLTLVSVEIPAA